ncbi:uncharacterized protein OCT59_013779 [Rhizophagus irregularis]|uniref:Uncharacterized protein n=2 Tax=Rhizophagus irregularis TaxID=588596 RepID=U9UBW9_RHIID|nr:hypothetical protein GLOIN_2v1598892 [Rhizophagus irregularis DAOM 181602=DAOM 197198]POG72161.1 hypothetical protein GLOIN_2v1598892 [Rhizophagus irregularis DAOM 181602=DAOM 197198]UZO21383.1 hypothetical protein OCT59_013779 [Rhizophagus irregularis]GET59054.1 hypothetical protein GLOIN_2v1598892 [Rhizophagus irregularis DAOM 181602=DAOM 197198]CAB5394501.1 unnamed protein product [Rhizophagus irregularis]|eukprot:XP_025179027.1 hypothetical protein GLOIN_2v1598892 [Rhizophagus irregularis DAOM 181602=DAOM 197198]
MTTTSKHHLFNQPTCVVEKILLQPTLNILDRCAISQTCKTLHKFTSTLYSIFDFPLSPSNITSLSHKKSLAIKPQELKSVPIIAVRSGVYNVAIGSDGDDYSAIFFNRKGIVRVVKVRTKKDGVSIECLYSVLVQRMLFTCTKFKDKVLLIESPPGKDYFAHTNTLQDIIEKFGKIALRKHYGFKLNSCPSSSSSNSTSQTTDKAVTTANPSSSTTNSEVDIDFIVWQNTKPTRDMLLKGIVGMIRRFRQREQANSKEFSTSTGCSEQRWYIKVLMQFHYRYLMCQQKLYVYGNSLRKRHMEIMNFLTNEFKGSLLSTFSNEWSYNNENESNSSNGIFSFVLMDLSKNSSSPSKKLSKSIGLTSSISSEEIEKQLAQLNERHLFLRTLMEKFKSVILANQGLDSCSIVFRNFQLQSVYEDLRTNLTKILHKREKVSEVIETTAIKLQLILKSLYEQDIRNKYSAMNKELARQGINVQLNNNDLKKSSAKSVTTTSSSSFNSITTTSTTIPRLTTYINTFNTTSTLPAYTTTTITSSPTTITSLASSATNEKRKDISKLAVTIPHQSDHDLSAESILDALLLQIPFEHIFSRKMFIKLLAQRHFETMCAEYGDHTARIDYDDYCSSSNEDLSDDGFFNNNNDSSSSADNNDDSDFFHHHYYNSSGRSFFYDIETGQHVSQDYARKFFINWFEQNYKKFCYKLVEIGDWLNATCYFLFISKNLLKDDCNWVEQYDESEGVCTTEWRFEIVEKVEKELINLTNDVVRPALLKKNCCTDIDEDNMIKIWKTWWLYACSEVLDNIETSNAKTVLEKMEDILEMKSSYATTSTCTTCTNKGKDKENETA